MEADGTSETVSGLTLVQLPGGSLAKQRVFEPVERGQRPLQSAELAQRLGKIVSLRIGPETSKDERRHQTRTPRSKRHDTALHARRPYTRRWCERRSSDYSSAQRK